MRETEAPQLAATPHRFPWRRLLQFRLRTLLILTTIVAIWLGWWSYKARQQRDAVVALTKAEVVVTCNCEQQKLKAFASGRCG